MTTTIPTNTKVEKLPSGRSNDHPALYSELIQDASNRSPQPPLGAHGQSEELITLKRDVLSFSPDLILLGFFSGNDLINNLKSLSMSVLSESTRPFFVLVNGQLVLDDSFRDPSASHYLRQFLLTATHYSRILGACRT